MSLNSSQTFFRPKPKFRHKAKISKRAVAIPAGGDHSLVNVNGQAGKLDTVHVNLEDADALLLVVEIDKQDIVRHTARQIHSSSAGNLALEIPNAVNDILATTKYASLNYAISFRAHLARVEFDNSMKVRVENIGSAEWDIQASYVLYAITRRWKIKGKKVK